MDTIFSSDESYTIVCECGFVIGCSVPHITCINNMDDHDSKCRIDKPRFYFSNKSTKDIIGIMRNKFN